MKENKTNSWEFEVNQNVLNIITPPGLEFGKSGMMSGENYAKCVYISSYPTNPKFGWLSKICSIEGTTASAEFRPTDSGPLIQRCDEQVNQLNQSLNSKKNESERQGIEESIDDIRNMIHRVNRKKEKVGYLNIMLKIEASTQEKLEERFKTVNSIVTSMGASIRNFTFNQDKAYQSIAPYGVPKEELQDMGERNMPLSTFLGGFANASSGINDGFGFLIGKSEDGKPIILNTWTRDGDRTNSNWFISGVQGVGKSTFIKALIFLEYALGSKIIILDPDSEYHEAVMNIGGKVINCGGGLGGRINILQVRPVPKLDDNDNPEKDDIYQDEGKGVSALALHFQTVRTFFRLYKKSITELHMAKLEEVLEKTYLRFHIDWNTDITGYKPSQFPILSDLYEDILHEYEADPNDNILKELVAYLRSISIGADSYIFNGQTDIEFNTEVVDLDVSSLIDGDKNVLEAQFHNINTWVWQQASRDRTEKVLYFLDEGYLYIDPDFPDLMKFLKNYSKRCRKYESGILFITHSVVDVLDKAIKRQGQALIDGACYKFIMGTDGKNLKETKELFDLTEAETNILAAKKRGRGLLFAGSRRVSATIKVSDKFMKMMGKAGGR